jgi:hypothetical protein
MLSVTAEMLDLAEGCHVHVFTKVGVTCEPWPTAVPIAAPTCAEVSSVHASISAATEGIVHAHIESAAIDNARVLNLFMLESPSSRGEELSLRASATVNAKKSLP